ncbi:HpcH/HpaI aldolase/citrate lyase family protein [Aquabacter spiritensis]|uniref:Citrate lyase subunit beta/citryl-CoA lyase n=1 Tax=Aquabacter spiritensis TaxID=933073 RepID=A0A4R3M3C7_9HYPH|nr:CoA ester lyase [Aquabacter spiritensis]TCT05665.1 citrate lyase subunit beta/citryl-CoA lyase [Aquabacter spiritensis]
MNVAPLPRSLLFAPAVRPDLMVKAAASGADALIFDLEDSVPPAAKAEARRALTAALTAHIGPPVYVRINHPAADDAAADIAALAGERLAGVFLPKAERPEEVQYVDGLLRAAEARLGRPDGGLCLVPMIETCLGLRHAYDLARAAPRVGGACLSSGEEGDFMVDLGGRWTPEGEALLYARGRLACESRAAGIEWLIDGVFMALDDEPALRRDARTARNMGYVAKMAIHPRQIAAIHDAFSPTAAEIDHAAGLVDAMRAAEAGGRGAVRYRGMMVDYANLKRAQKILAQAERGKTA